MINYETLKAMQEIDAARAAVEPAVGKLAMSFDTADRVYVHALKTLGYTDAGKLRGQGNAAKVVFNALRGRPAPTKRMAADSASAGRLESMFPDMNRLSRSA